MLLTPVDVMNLTCMFAMYGKDWVRRGLFAECTPAGAQSTKEGPQSFHTERRQSAALHSNSVADDRVHQWPTLPLMHAAGKIFSWSLL